VLVVAGSKGMAGAAALTATAALKSGAGYVEIICPAALLPALTEAVPAAMVHSCGDESRSQVGAADVSAILAVAARASAVVLGPGLGAAVGEPWLPYLLMELQEDYPQLPLVLDADGLNQLATSCVDLNICAPNMILTPHPGEAARLLRWDSAAAVQADRAGAVTTLAQACSAAVLLKGAGTLVQQAGEDCWQNHSGNVGMATAGSGDVLSGHLGALLASGLTPYNAARLGAYLHGRAGDLFAAQWGMDGLTASDLAAWISKAMQEWRTNPVEVSA
jgi:NAD(P)H-hydrate epimerase